ncbi:dephospho-CoA kinase [Porphyromonas sp.]|uniref:dephospho-CoA kinase n=1 Tax=Porphyromonas sp. TaxID=1924944 RepID=UPI0026DD0DBA|nr:dephospho-CoA kinase [Porphyromonas sp.]MDO4770847.1 dephospho-CoA kinase [Porphyromonas sp.]
MNHPKIIGVCGLIGSGKSVVMRYFEHLGYPVYDCDTVAKAVYYDTDVRDEVTSLLGFDPIDGQGSLQKSRISAAMADPLIKKALESIVHRAVLTDFDRWKSLHSDAEAVFMESAILFTSRFDTVCDLTIAVEAPIEVRRARVLDRDGVGDPLRFDRIDALQQDEALLIKGATYHINNDNKCSVLRQLERIASELTDKNTQA